MVFMYMYIAVVIFKTGPKNTMPGRGGGGGEREGGRRMEMEGGYKITVNTCLKSTCHVHVATGEPVMKYSKCAPFNDIYTRNIANHCLRIVERSLKCPLLSKTAQPNAQKMNTDRQSAHL